MEIEAITKIVSKLEAESVIYYKNFFSFEGVEGSGKSTIMTLVGKRLADEGMRVFLTREPGGTNSPKAEAIRSLIYLNEMSDMTDLTAALLYASARTQHVQEVILPYLAKDYLVLTDRFVDSSLVYQGLQENILEQVTLVNFVAIVNTMPQTTFFLDVPPEIGLKRIFDNSRQETNYLDYKSLAYHEAIYRNYQTLARVFDKRYIAIDAKDEIDRVVDAVYHKIKEQLKEK